MLSVLPLSLVVISVFHGPAHALPIRTYKPIDGASVPQGLDTSGSQSSHNSRFFPPIVQHIAPPLRGDGPPKPGELFLPGHEYTKKHPGSFYGPPSETPGFVSLDHGYPPAAPKAYPDTQYFHPPDGPNPRRHTSASKHGYPHPRPPQHHPPGHPDASYPKHITYTYGATSLPPDPASHDVLPGRPNVKYLPEDGDRLVFVQSRPRGFLGRPRWFPAPARIPPSSAPSSTQSAVEGSTPRTDGQGTNQEKPKKIKVSSRDKPRSDDEKKRHRADTLNTLEGRRKT